MPERPGKGPPEPLDRVVPRPHATSVTDTPALNSHAARSNNTRRRIATGDSPVARESCRAK
ncbi:hypothetical protein [Nocardia terpenica]|uniref:hypothetical protein n=1 Tax=Nocardia terpenica TaxID=455432 RepID=UPI003184082B